MQPAIRSEEQFPAYVRDALFARLDAFPRQTSREIATWLWQLGYEIAPSTVNAIGRRRRDERVPKGPRPAPPPVLPPPAAPLLLPPPVEEGTAARETAAPAYGGPACAAPKAPETSATRETALESLEREYLKIATQLKDEALSDVGRIARCKALAAIKERIEQFNATSPADARRAGGLEGQRAIDIRTADAFHAYLAREHVQRPTDQQSEIVVDFTEPPEQRDDPDSPGNG